MDVRLYQKIKVILFNDFSPPPSLIDDAFEKKIMFITLLPKMVLFFEFFMHIVSRLNYLTFKGLRR